MAKLAIWEGKFAWNELFSPLTRDCNMLASCPAATMRRWLSLEPSSRYSQSGLARREVNLQELPRCCLNIIGTIFRNARVVTYHDCGIDRSICSVVAGFVIDWEGSWNFGAGGKHKRRTIITWRAGFLTSNLGAVPASENFGFYACFCIVVV